MSGRAQLPRSAAVLTLAAAVVLPGALGAARADTAGAAAVPRAVISDPLVDVGSPALSNTGRYVGYIAVRRDEANPRTQVRRADLAGGASELLNPSIDGGIAAGKFGLTPVISGDGSRIAFTSNASRLVQGDGNHAFDAFVRDASSDTTVLASVGFDGQAANNDTGIASLSKSGRYVVFTSSATDVVPGSTTTNSDVYLRDLTTNMTAQVTVRRDGSPSRGPGSSAADVSADGRLVAFNSYNNDLAPTDRDGGDADLFIRNMKTGFTRWLSPGLPPGADPTGVVISPDGRWISSRWGDGSLHLTNVSTRTTSTVADPGYALLGAFSGQLDRYVFISGGLPYVRDLATGVNTAIPVPTGGHATNVTISGNGRYAAYDWAPGDGSASRIYRVALG